MDPGAADAPGAPPPESEPEPKPESADPTPQQSSSPPPPSEPPPQAPPASSSSSQPPSRYESQKRRDWNTFLQYLKNHKPPLTLPRCSGAHVIEFLKYLDQFGKTKVHSPGCPHFGRPNPPAPCSCPLKQAWGSLDALIGRLRAAYEESGGKPESNPFGTKAVRIYLREVRESQAKARGIPYEKKKRKRSVLAAGSSSATVATPTSTSTSAATTTATVETTTEGGDEKGRGEPTPATDRPSDPPAAVSSSS